MSSDIVVLGDGAFREIGEPRKVEISGNIVAVAGSMGVPQWAGASVKAVVGEPGWQRVGVYDRSTLECRLLVPLRWPVNVLAFDPTGKYLAIGAGSYDGGFCYDGELVLVDLERGGVVSLLREWREVVGIGWAGDGAIEIVVLPATDEDDPEPQLFRISRELWAEFGRKSVSLAEMQSVACEEPPQTEVEVAQQLSEIAASASQSHAVRRQVWDVHVDASGEVSACSEGVRIEVWAASGERKLFEPTEGRGCQLYVVDDHSVLTVVEPPLGPPMAGSRLQPSSIEVLDRKNGRQVRSVEVSFPAAAFASDDGSFIIRNVNPNRREGNESLFLSDLASDAEPVVVSGYNLFNHPFRIRRAPDVILLVGDRVESYRNKWVARVVCEEVRFGVCITAVQRLFPLEWDAKRDAHLMGGPGCWMADGQESSLFHGGWIHDGRGLLDGNSFLVCRSGRSGEPRWEYRASAQFSGVDIVDGRIWATLMSGELVCLDGASGEVIEITKLTVDSHPVVPLSICGADGWLAIGLLDGRVLRAQL